MFAKLLKMEFRSTWNILGILCLSLVGAGLLGGFASRYLLWSSMREQELAWADILCVLVLITAFLFFAVCGAAALIVVTVRFYRSRFTDEGYLTFTLPVTTHQVLLSSFVSSALNMLIVGAVICVSLVLLGLFMVSGLEGFWSRMSELYPILWEKLRQLLDWETLRVLGLFLADAVTGSACELVLIMLAVTIGSLAAKKHKILAAFAFYYILHVAIFTVSGIALVKLADTPEGVFGFWAAVNLVIAVVGYFLMYFLVDKKLNLN